MEQVEQQEPKKRGQRVSRVDQVAFNMRLQGATLEEIAAKQGCGRSTAWRRVGKVEEKLGRDVVVENIRDSLLSFADEGVAAVLTGLRQVEPSIVNAYFKGLGVYVDKANLEVQAISAEEIERRRLAASSRGMALFGFVPVDAGKVDKAVDVVHDASAQGGQVAQGDQAGGGTTFYLGIL